ncbi:MAG: WD40 repeat domain-containing protein, partial [Caldilineaceae bacterium]|nr:WD40 repeat domain-containing protein [Caldilineaceae bacterium]
RLLTPDLRGWNFSHLSMCQADLRSGALAGVNLQSADLSGAAFINTIDLINTIAVSPNGEYLAAGASDGAVYIWRTVDYQLHCVLHHHTRVISSLVFTQDSTLLASSSLDGLICIWELKHTSLLRVLTNNGKSIVALTLHADNHLLAAATTDKVIGLWDLEQTEPQILLQVATNITALAFSPNGQWLIWVGDQQKIHVWDVQSCEQLYLLQGHKEKILTVAFHPQGKFFATGGEDGQICLWDTTTMQPRQVLTGHTDFVLALAFSADGNYLASSGADATVRIWAIATGKQQQLFLGHHGWIKVIVYSPDGQTLISGGYDQTIRFWHVPSGQLLRVLQGYLNRIDLSSFSQDGSRLATCGLDGTIRIWSVATATLLHTLHGPQAATRNMVFSHDNTMLVTAGDDHIVRLWDLPCGRLRHVLRGHRGSARSIAFTPDERAVISGSHDGTLRIWNVASGLLQETLSNVCATIQSAIAVSPQQQYLAFGTVDGAIHVRHLPTNSLVQTLDIAPAKIVVLSFDASGQQLACGTDDGQVLLYTLSNSDKQYRLRHHFHLTESSIWRLLFSPETSQLAWICAGQEIQHFDLATGQTYEPMRTYFGAFCLTFAHDGQTLFTDGRDHAVLMRDAKTGVIRKTLHGHTAGITSINSSPAANVIASTSFDGTIRLWDADDGTCLAVMRVPGPYAGMNITNVTGISSAQRDALIALGAVSDSITPGESPSEIQVSHTAIRLDRSMLAN